MRIDNSWTSNASGPFSLIALEEVRMPREYRTWRGAQIAAIEWSRHWKSMVVVLDKYGRECGHVVYDNSDGKRPPNDKTAVCHTHFWLKPLELLA